MERKEWNFKRKIIKNLEMRARGKRMLFKPAKLNN